ncbi:autotransporter family protein [Methylophaga thalassica]|uniref:autotransporter family protein n=1 Tax=Methylophaga TaxID=40222 RepID=UPI002E7B8219|nr:autotransporter outer membrane beta-barrel domain-containing protein [Methylophaga thalassica]WVI85511.1 autotransporter outer membrane beta-barrel domain-containing protein [Methylophaga thalassica]
MVKFFLRFTFFSLLIVSFSANAGHLFTQGSSNTPINLKSGQGIEITQLSYESAGASGLVDIHFLGTGVDNNVSWSAGDSLKVTIGSWSQTFSYDTLATDFSNVTQSASSFRATDPTLAAANITPSGTTTFTIEATSGQFTFDGYRISVNGARYNGSNSGPIDQSQVVSSSTFQSNAGSNQKTGVGQHLDQISGNVGGKLDDFITLLASQTPEKQQEVLKSISPEQSQALGQSVNNTVSGSFDTVQVRLDSLRLGGTDVQNLNHSSGLSSGGVLDGILERHAWVKALGGKSKQDSEDGFAGADSRYHGVMGGMDFTNSSDLTLGAAFAYARTDVNMNDYRDGDGADIDTYQLTAYFNQSFERFYVEGMLTYAYQNYETKRNTHVIGVAKGDFDGDMFAARLVSGMPLYLEQFTVTPFFGVEAYHTRQRGYTEKGADYLSMHINSNESNRFRSLVGTKVSKEFELSDGSILTPTLQVSWRHEFKEDGITTTSSFLGGGGQFESVGQNVDRNTGSISGRVNWAKTDSLSLGVELGAEASSGYRAYNGQLYADWTF